MVVGHADYLEGRYVIGWALADGSGTPCRIEIFDDAGRLLGSGPADRSRDDLAALKRGRIDFGFRLPISEFGDTSLLRVLADGVELVNSPMPVGQGVFDGFIRVAEDTVVGWVAERIAAPVAPVITVEDLAGNVIATTRAGLTTPREAAALPPDGRFRPYWFSIALPNLCFTGSPFPFRVSANGSPFTTATVKLEYRGSIDRIRPGQVSGWVNSPEAPRRVFQVEIWQDGRKVAAGRANRPRADLADQYPESWKVGFDLSWPVTPAQAADVSRVSVRLGGTSRNLFDGPFLLGRPVSFIGAAHRLARIARGGTIDQLEPHDPAILLHMLGSFLATTRESEDDWITITSHEPPPPQTTSLRLSIVVPVYRDLAATRACLDSVLRTRTAETDRIIVVNDRSPEPGMVVMLGELAAYPNVVILHNEENLGFVRSVNRALDHCESGDVLLLNSDTRLFFGGLDELVRVAASPGIGTVTAISNNATIFSYPYLDHGRAALEDVSWEELAEVALFNNRGLAIDVPTGHGFCLLIRRELLDRIPRLNEAYGRGYGEENDFCLRASAMGYRHVAAPGALVEHSESLSFGPEKAALLAHNLAVIEESFPEYAQSIALFQSTDDLRRGRWALDTYRLAKASGGGARFALVVESWVGHGTRRAIEDIQAAVGFGQMVELRLRGLENGFIELRCAEPGIRALFAPGEEAALFRLLKKVKIQYVAIHQLLGFDAAFIRLLTPLIKRIQTLYYVHDFYPICPRVTLIDAADTFCGLADLTTCTRCVAIGGSHLYSRIADTTPADHRALFAALFNHVDHVVTPSDDTASYMARAFPAARLVTIPHPQSGLSFARRKASGASENIVLLGALGPHKGSTRLLELLKVAGISHPRFHFHLIGYSDIDEQLLVHDNITITGPYTMATLPELIEKAHGVMALFLSEWPETFLYTLSEAVSFGLFPVVPDLGAPAERVKRAEYGCVYPFPIDVRQVLETLELLCDGVGIAAAAGSPERFDTSGSAALTREVLHRLV